MKKVLVAGAIALALYLLAMGALRSERVQDALLARAVTAIAGSQPTSAGADSLRVFVCGSASPLGMTDQAPGLYCGSDGRALLSFRRRRWVEPKSSSRQPADVSSRRYFLDPLPLRPY